MSYAVVVCLPSLRLLNSLIGIRYTLILGAMSEKQSSPLRNCNTDRKRCTRMITGGQRDQKMTDNAE